MFKGSSFKKVSNAFKSPKLSGSKSDPDTDGGKFSDRFKIQTPKLDKDTFKSVSTSIKEQTLNNTELKVFDASLITKLGIKGKITNVVYDYTQGLMAVATSSSKIHIFGQKNIEIIFALNNKTTVKSMKFVKGIYMVIVDNKDTIIIYSLFSKQILATVYCPSKITCIETDPSVDWILLGLQSGSIIIYDVDRNQFSDVKIENLQKSQFFTKVPLSPIVSISWNPRDLGTILISYELVTVTYSFVEGITKQEFIYKIPPYAPGGDFTADISRERIPKVIQSLYHPNSLHILTVHEDNSMVFWDANTGKLIQARTLYETNVNAVQKDDDFNKANTYVPKIFKVAWICQHNPEYTSLIIATRPSSSTNHHDEISQGICIVDLGGTPLYSVTSYDAMSKYYANTRQEKMCPIINKSSIVDITPIATSSPYFAGGHAASCILVLLENGEMDTLLSSSGLYTSKASLLPQNLSLCRPYATTTSAVSVPSKLWLGMMASNSKYDGLLRGGIVNKKGLKVKNIRNVLISGHINGAVRLWDACANELDESAVFEINISRILNRSNDVSIDKISFAPETLELAVAAVNGDVVLFKYEVNQFFDPQGEKVDKSLDLSFSRFSIEDINEPLIDVRDRSPSNTRQGIMPGCVIRLRRGSVTALQHSNIGFVGIAYANGDITVIDRRGPAIIYLENLDNLVRRKCTVVTSIEFEILQYRNDNYSSILMLCGTDCGELIVNKILPAAGGRFYVENVDVIRTGDRSPVSKILAIANETGFSCEATVSKMQSLTKGDLTPGSIITIGSHDVRTVPLNSTKQNVKSFKHNIASVGLSYASYENSKNEFKIKSYVIVYLTNGSIKILNSQDLKEVKTLHSPIPVHTKYVMQSSVLKDGDIFARTDDYEVVLVSTVNKQSLVQDDSKLYNPNLRIPARPQVNSLQWARGTIYCTSEQLDEVLGGSKRPLSKYQESEIAKGTLSQDKPKGNQMESSEHHYVKPVRHVGRSSGYGILKGVSRTLETQWDSLESQFNDYATAFGEGMNDAMEQTGKDIVKGSFGI
ncbi:hypothetical protein RI543_002712 [Arxiozyma heterogenica]|uniref:Lethal giant larvae (Lgl)-like C-terminal domain-containing protein n=1 Tax=Arxiozyma heterogenica TaxID=278026 RepID=A0AAN7W320_9SACH|nr:hypothetical protein RI543_002712 [Kazachstania heterogenica]